MVVVVLGFKEYEIHEAHGNVQTRMNRAASEHFRVEAFKPVYDFDPALAAAMKLRDHLQGRKVVCVMSGGNSKTRLGLAQIRRRASATVCSIKPCKRSQEISVSRSAIQGMVKIRR